MLKKWTKMAILVPILLILMVADTVAEDYKFQKQSEALYGAVNAWYMQDTQKYIFHMSELNRYGMLIFQEHLDHSQKEWIENNVWMIRKAEWVESRKTMGSFVPRDSISVYLEILMENENLPLLREQEILGKPLCYVESRSIMDQP